MGWMQKQQLARGTHRTEHERPIVRRLPRDLRAAAVDLLEAVGQVVSRKNEGAAAEGVRQDDLRSGVDVALRNLRHALGILQVPAFRRGPGLEPELLEFGAPGAVRQNAARGRYQVR